MLVQAATWSYMWSLVLGTRRQQACSKQSGRSLISTCSSASESLMLEWWQLLEVMMMVCRFMAIR